MTLAPGLYLLKQNVLNPSPDRRMKYDWRKKPVWPKGAKFHVEADHFDMDVAGGRRVEFVVMFMSGNGRSSRISEHDDLFKLLAPALEPASVEKQTLDDLLGREPNLNLAKAALERLLASGKLTLDDIEAALADVA